MSDQALLRLLDIVLVSASAMPHFLAVWQRSRQALEREIAVAKLHGRDDLSPEQWQLVLDDARLAAAAAVNAPMPGGYVDTRSPGTQS
jgi:hypothetical protein